TCKESKDSEVSTERSVISEGGPSLPATQITSRHPKGEKLFPSAIDEVTSLDKKVVEEVRESRKKYLRETNMIMLSLKARTNSETTTEEVHKIPDNSEKTLSASTSSRKGAGYQ
ncbi:21093_t:CDS:2, partial [Gigaspora margarita]